MARPRRHFWERFWERVSGGDGCWEWTGTINRGGYGMIAVRGTNATAHRTAWQMTVGPIPDGMLVCHRCDNPRCVRSDHLFLGTHADNSRDMASKGRAARGERHGARMRPGSRPRGERHPLAKLRESDVLDIRELAKRGVSQRAIAEKYGVSRSAVSNVLYGLRWKAVV